MWKCYTAFHDLLWARLNTEISSRHNPMRCGVPPPTIWGTFTTPDPIDACGRWCWLMLIDVDWCWLMLIDANWFWLTLIDANWCLWMLMLIDADWLWLMLVDAGWCWLILVVIVCFSSLWPSQKTNIVLIYWNLAELHASACRPDPTPPATPRAPCQRSQKGRTSDSDWCWLVLIDADWCWCWLMLIDANWCWMPIDSDWCWLMPSCYLIFLIISRF